MVLEGRLTYQGDGMTISTRAMNTQITRLKTHTDNIANFGMPGYQRKNCIVTSFVEYLGSNGLDESISTEVGRLRRTDNPMDFAISTSGYFQKLGKDGNIELTRDGRFQLDKEGHVLALDGKQILSAAGIPMQLPVIPTDLVNQVRVSTDGEMTVFDEKRNEVLPVGRIGVANQDGSVVSDIDIRQGHVEDSNVYLQREFVSIMPLRREFEANRQLFIIQSDALSRMIQELGRTQ